MVNIYSLYSGNAEAMEIIVHGDSKTSKQVDKKISEIDLPKKTIIGAIVRKEKVILANNDLVIKADDHIIIFVLEKKDIPKIEKMFQVSVGFF